ncbi:2741_t:CDS:2, partial [Entrophospora sp. SA101]
SISYCYNLLSGAKSIKDILVAFELAFKYSGTARFLLLSVKFCSIQALEDALLSDFDIQQNIATSANDVVKLSDPLQTLLNQKIPSFCLI